MGGLGIQALAGVGSLGNLEKARLGKKELRCSWVDRMEAHWAGGDRHMVGVEVGQRGILDWIVEGMLVAVQGM